MLVKYDHKKAKRDNAPIVFSLADGSDLRLEPGDGNKVPDELYKAFVDGNTAVQRYVKCGAISAIAAPKGDPPSGAPDSKKGTAK